MAHDPMNPFGLPSMGASMGSSSQNPLLASMDMMRQAMTGLGQSAQSGTSSLSNPLTPEDLERKINDLKVIENWLKLNLSMLSSSIQGLEVQLATVKTLRSFVAMGQAPAAATANNPSPLEVALGLKPAPTSTASPPPTSATQTASAEPATSDPSTAAKDKATDGSANNAAAQAWWNMLESQFHQLAAATSQATNQATAAAHSAVSKSVAPETPASSTRKTTTQKSPAKTTNRRAPSKQPTAGTRSTRGGTKKST